jgi:hypothetical protein
MQIMFAHFYSRLPRHLVLNLKRTILLFPEHEVFLVTDQETDDLHLSNLQIKKYSPSPEWYKIESILSHPTDFRNNFWFISLARFIAIAEVSKGSTKPILHIESDVILASDFPFDLFSDLDKDFAFPVVSKELAIASCLYFRSGLAAEELARFTMNAVQSNHSTTDMHILRDFANRNYEKVQVLPSAPSQPDAFDNASDEFLNQTKFAIPLFNGIFDGFDIGRYLFGDDPRNDRGFSILRKNDARTYLNASKIELSVTEEREFPFVRNSVEPFILPIYALHIHSKKLNLFRQNRMSKIIKKAVLESKRPSKKIFSLRIFLASALRAIRRRIKRSKVL